MIDEVLVGQVLYSRVLLDAPRRLVEVLVLSPVAVRPDCRNMSVGSALINESLRALATRPEPLVFLEGQSAQSLGLTGRETFSIPGLDSLTPSQQVTVEATDEKGNTRSFQAKVRLDTETDVQYYRNRGILPYVLRKIVFEA